MVEQTEYAILVGMVPLMHRLHFPSWEGFNAAGEVFDEPYWSDEILRVPGDLRFSAQAANAWAENENVAAYNNGFAEASIWLEAIAMHRLKNPSHSWFTPLIRNNVFNELTAAHAACHGATCQRPSQNAYHTRRVGRVTVHVGAMLANAIAKAPEKLGDLAAAYGDLFVFTMAAAPAAMVADIWRPHETQALPDCLLI